MLNSTLNLMLIACVSYWGTGRIALFTAVIARIYGQAIPVLSERNSHMWTKEDP